MLNLLTSFQSLHTCPYKTVLCATAEKDENLNERLAQREKQYEYYRNKLLTFE